VHVTLGEGPPLLALFEWGDSGAPCRLRRRAGRAVANTLAENRNYVDGVIISYQLPTKLVGAKPDAVKNPYLKIIHRRTAEDDRRYLGETMGMDDAQRLFSARLRRGSALLYSDGPRRGRARLASP